MYYVLCFQRSMGGECQVVSKFLGAIEGRDEKGEGSGLMISYRIEILGLGCTVCNLGTACSCRESFESVPCDYILCIYSVVR